MAAGFAQAMAQMFNVAIDNDVEEDEIMEDDTAWPSQWAITDGGYTGMGKTIQVLPSGHYDLAVDNGRLIWAPVPARKDDLIRFPESNIDQVVSEIEKFWLQEKVFQEFGLQFKRGVLLWGPPGAGKTTALTLISRDVVKRGGIVINYPAGASNLLQTAVRMLRVVQPETPIVVLMEDLDALFGGRDESHVLNLLDGVEPVHKVLYMATTNYPEKLGPRVINRPSRFDRRFFIGHPTSGARRQYLEHLGAKPDLIPSMVSDTDHLSVAHLKELFIATHVLDVPYKDALQRIRSMEDKISSIYDGSDEGNLDKALKEGMGGGYA